MTLELRQRLLGTTLLAGACLFAPAAAQAQTPQEPADANTTTSTVQGTVAPLTNADAKPAETPADIVITGSRIPQPNLTSTSPVTVVSAQEVKLSGVTRVEDLINSLPQAFADQTSTDSNGATGIATVNLRNLGAARTLVLINGRRLMPSDVSTPVADLNFIPSALVKRVDVLTGGASSVYGSDALAGVVNFIMDTTFTGVRVDAQGSFYQHDNHINSYVTDVLNARGYDYPSGNVIDGGQQDATVSIGADLGGDHRGHVVAYAGYRHVSAITQGDRDFSACGLSGNFDTGPSGYLVCGGSSTSAAGRFRRTVLTSAPGAPPVFGGVGSSFSIDPNGDARLYSGARDGFNFNPYNYFQRPDERYTLGAFANYEISSGFQPYMEAMFMNDRSVAQIAPSGAFYGTDFAINCANPFLHADLGTDLCGANYGVNTIQSVYIGRRNVEGGPRVSDLRHTDYRIIAGMKGDIARGLSYDVYGQYGHVNQSAYSTGDFSRTRLNRSLDVVSTLGGAVVPTGTPGSVAACRSAIPNADGVVVDPLCVPYDIFSGAGPSQAAIDYLQVPNIVEGDLGQNVLDGVLTFNGAEYGFQTPWAKNGIGLAIGAEYRKDSIQIRNDVQNLTGDIAGTGAPNGVSDADGYTTVKEVFAEANIPIASDMPGFYDLELNLSGRHSKYNIAGSTDAYKIGADYAPTPDIKLRASYNRAVRAPNVLELFTPQTVILFGRGSGDPCTGGLDPANPGFLAGGGSVANCLLQFNGSGVTDAQALAALTNGSGVDDNPAAQYNQRVAGNVNLTPETSDSYTLGLVLTPRFLPGFSATIDGFDIRVKNLIGTLGASFILSQCTATGDPYFCTLIHRSADGSLFTGPSFIENAGLNTGAVKTRGVDVSANYRTPILWGNTRLQLSLVGTYLDRYVVTPLSGDQDIGSYHCEGLFGDTCGTPLPKWRHRFRVTVPFNQHLSLSGMWRHFSKVTIDYDDPNPLVGNGPGTSTAFGLVPAIKAQDYFDLALQASFEKMTMRLGVNNIMDKNPPITPNFSNNGSNTYAGVYDSLGRYIFAGVTVDF